MIFSAKFEEPSLFLEGSGKVGDMARLMESLYAYWFHKGYWGTVSSAAVSFVNALVILVVAFLFTMRFQWDFALDCTSETECSSRPLFSGLSVPHVFSATFWGYFFGLSFLTSALVAAVYEAHLLRSVRHVAHEIDDMARSANMDTGFLTPWHRWQHDRQWREATAAGRDYAPPRREGRRVVSLSKWGDFLETMCDYLSSQGRLKSCESGIRLDALRAVQALMQRDNYLIALYDAGVTQCGALRYMTPEMLEFLVSSSLDPYGTVYTRDDSIWHLKEAVFKYAAVNFTMYFLVATFSVVKLLVKNAAQVKADFRQFSQRDWNTTARWRFRLFNEVAYLHDSRLANGRDTAATMTSRLSLSNNTRGLFRRLSSTCVLVTVLLTFLNPSLLLGGSIGGVTLVWWLTIALFMYSAFSADDPREREYAYTADLDKLVGQVHFTDREWEESGESFYNNITAYFLKPRAVLLLDNLARTLAAPCVLLYSLHDGSLLELLRFMQENSVVVDGVGSVPLDAAFQEPAAAAAHEGFSQSRRRPSDGDSAPLLSGRDPPSPAPSHLLESGLFLGAGGGAFTGDRTRGEKKMQSVASFCAVYPQWMKAQLGDESATPAAHGRDGDGNDDGYNDGLRDFVRQLDSQVRRALDDGAPPRLAAVDPAPREPALAESLAGDSWPPQFSRQSNHRKHWRAPGGGGGDEEEMQSLRGQRHREDDASEDFLEAADGSPLRADTTTHTREQLFVSRVGLSSADRAAANGTNAPSPFSHAASAVGLFHSRVPPERRHRDKQQSPQNVQ